MPWLGMTLCAEPELTTPQTTLTPARGSSRRERIAGTSVMTLPSANVTSWVRCGREVWPPEPVRRTSIRSAAPVSGPSRSPTCPTSTVGSQCRLKIRSTPSSAPAAIRSRAPPGMTSSAGWKSSRTRPCSSAVGVRLGQRVGGTHQRRRVHVVPTGVRDARGLARPRVPARVVDGQRVEVGAQRHERTLVTEVGDQPGLAGAGDPPSGAGDLCGRELGGAPLGPRELGVLVQVTAQVDQLVGAASRRRRRRRARLRERWRRDWEGQDATSQGRG